MQDHTKLRVWQRAHQLMVLTFMLLQVRGPRGTAGLCDQLRRSTASIVSNIAEGAAQQTSGQFARFLAIAIGSASEASAQLLMARDIGVTKFADWHRADSMLSEVRRMLINLLQRVRERAKARP